jgi:hypothetical protein
MGFEKMYSEQGIAILDLQKYFTNGEIGMIISSNKIENELW